MLTLCSYLLFPAVANSESKHETFAGNRQANTFIKDMVDRHQLDESSLKQLFATTHLREDIIEAISRPAEHKPWYEYRPIFLTKSRIEGGALFWKKHAALLTDIEKRFGVDASVIVAIVGVETRYGNNTGSYRVIDAISTLAFGYPKRSTFFTKELEQFLLLAKEEKVNLKKAKGSYAGAMGLGQFMPSSYREYAVDYDEDGKRDLWTNMGDILGSVANYLRVHGWKHNQPVAYRASASKRPSKAMLDEGYKPKHAPDYYLKSGIKSEQALGKKTPVALIALEQKSGPEYWLTMNNFYVITRYNRSPLYAMAVLQLSQSIKAAYNR